MLAGKENAGKFFHTVDFIDDMGKTVSWEIDQIDQKIKDFVDSQLKISEAASSAITSGMDLSSVNTVPEYSIFGGWSGYSIELTFE